MSFKTPITITSAVDHIKRAEFVLPAIQREFIWTPQQIVRLFDSLMLGYPIGSFLFWKVDRDHCKEYKFYKFLDSYHELNQHHNLLADVSGDARITAILDGQQRLTALYIGLRGTYAYKTKHKRWDNPSAFPKRKLYLNLIPQENSDSDLKHDLRFLTIEEARREPGHWFWLGDVIDFEGLRGINRYLRKHELIQEEYPEACLTGLWQSVCHGPLVNYYEEEDQDIDKVLNIFIRINSGGSQLEYSDLLLSIATAQWTQLDAREEIHELVDELNQIGDGFSLGKDFVLKSCLVLADISDIGYKVSNFTRQNTKRIEDQWPAIRKALSLALTLVSRFGYGGATLASYNTLIPIAYFILKQGNPEAYIDSTALGSDRKRILTWLARALLAQAFSGNSDTTLQRSRMTIDAHLREGTDSSSARFPRKELEKALGVRFQEEDLDELLDMRYGGNRAFPLLTLLFPRIGHSGTRFHIDHIFPRSFFTKARLRRLGIEDENTLERMLERRDRMANLQLLESTLNIEKSDRMPHEWLGNLEPDVRARWSENNLVSDLPQDMTGFREFYNTRRKKMRERLAKVLDL